MTGRSTCSLISLISTTVLARIPFAPPSFAALAILPMMKEECRGSFGKAWHDTINCPFVVSILFIILVSFMLILSLEMLHDNKC